MVTSADIYDTALRELRTTRQAMIGTTWEMALEGRPPAVQLPAARTLLNVGKAIRALADAGGEVCDMLPAGNEAALARGITDLARARAASTRVEEVVEGAQDVLDLLRPIVSFRPI